jgi:hypothetical protein
LHSVVFSIYVAFCLFACWGHGIPAGKAWPASPPADNVLVIKTDSGTEIIVACGMGGDLTRKPGASTGFQSQSLKAAYQLSKAGYRVLHVKVLRFLRLQSHLCAGGACW